MQLDSTSRPPELSPSTGLLPAAPRAPSPAATKLPLLFASRSLCRNVPHPGTFGSFPAGLVEVPSWFETQSAKKAPGQGAAAGAQNSEPRLRFLVLHGPVWLSR